MVAQDESRLSAVDWGVIPAVQRARRAFHLATVWASDKSRSAQDWAQVVFAVQGRSVSAKRVVDEAADHSTVCANDVCVRLWRRAPLLGFIEESVQVLGRYALATIQGVGLQAYLAQYWAKPCRPACAELAGPFVPWRTVLGPRWAVVGGTPHAVISEAMEV
jgi:hypothetical protein